MPLTKEYVILAGFALKTIAILECNTRQVDAIDKENI